MKTKNTEPPKVKPMPPTETACFGEITELVTRIKDDISRYAIIGGSHRCIREHEERLTACIIHLSKLSYERGLSSSTTRRIPKKTSSRPNSRRKTGP